VNVPTADNGQNMLVENVNDLSTPRSAISSENSNDTMSNVLNAVASLAKSYSGLQDTVNHLLKSKQTQKIYDTGREGFTLQQWYSSDVVNSASVTNFPVSENCTATANQNPEISQGVRSDSYSNIDIISPSLERQILEGKDVNLASLLIPNYECPQTHTITTNSLEVNVPGKPDVRLNRALTIQEFIKAFGKYKRVMTAVYPARREELDAYAEDIVDISNFYGPKFYDYHKMFSAKAAALLTKLKKKVDWSKRDRDILSLIAAGVKVNVCKLCSMSDHTTKFCPLQLTSEAKVQSENNVRGNDRNDRYGRPRYFQEGKEICNNFNGKGCIKSNCSFLHVCSKCRSANHSFSSCSKRPAASASTNQNAGIATDKGTSKTPTHK